jgi:LPS-assembly protein
MALSLGVAPDIRSAYYRGLATAGLEFRWPILFSTTSATHILEPIAQIFARTDETYASTLDTPNEDAQSLVFDAASLFERDKFSGYDRMEGGTRANLGFRYSASYGGGWTVNAIFGQSYHLGGINSFASPDLVNAGAFSGLETDRSDYVGLVGLTSSSGLTISAGGRFDEVTFETRRAEATARLVISPVMVAARFAYIQAQPLYGFPNDRKETTVSGSLRFDENWRAYGAATYDFESETRVKTSVGFAYDDECFTYMMTYVEGRNIITKEATRSVGFHLSFRTLGDIGTSTSQFEQ